MRRQAKRNHEQGLSWLRRWFIQKYKLPPSSPLFLGQSVGELLLEMYEDLHERQGGLHAELDALEATPGAAGRQARDHVLEQINCIHRALGEPEEDYDPVIAKWEREIAAGQIPNLRER